jgi:hypothetical protein
VVGQEDDQGVFGEQFGDCKADTGGFFWAAVRGGEWECQYRVIFFDGEGKGLSMRWAYVLYMRLEIMVDESSSKRFRVWRNSLFQR